MDNELVERLAAKERECEDWKAIAVDAQKRAYQLDIQVRILKSAIEALRDL